jgi:uncharacterized protein YndB with AHSA1/START domain
MAVAVDDRTLRLVRNFDASRERLYAAWTDRDQFAQWFGPQGVDTVYCDLDVRAGGAWRLLGQGGDGQRYAVSGIYREVKPPERLSFTWAWHEKGDHDMPRGHETTVTLEFKARGAKTEMIMTQTRFADTDSVAAHNRGWTSAFGKLDALLARNP